MSRPILIFKTDRFTVPVSNDPHREPPEGRELAEWLAEALRSKGLNVSGPYNDTSLGFCGIDVDIGTQPFWIMVQLELLGPDRGEEYWSVSVHRRHGCLGSLFASRSTDGDLLPCITVVRDIVATQTIGSDARWVTEQELDDQRER